MFLKSVVLVIVSAVAYKIPLKSVYTSTEVSILVNIVVVCADTSSAHKRRHFAL